MGRGRPIRHRKDVPHLPEPAADQPGGEEDQDAVPATLSHLGGDAGNPGSALIGSSARKSPIQTRGKRFAAIPAKGEKRRGQSAPERRDRPDPDRYGASGDPTQMAQTCAEAPPSRRWPVSRSRTPERRAAHTRPGGTARETGNASCRGSGRQTRTPTMKRLPGQANQSRGGASAIEAADRLAGRR